jgi:capsular polysaccharide biosynthesis protein
MHIDSNNFKKYYEPVNTANSGRGYVKLWVVRSCLLLGVIVFIIGFLVSPKFYQSQAKLLFDNHEYAKSQKNILQSEILMEQLALRLLEKAGAVSKLEKSPLPFLNASWFLKSIESSSIPQKQRLINALNSGFQIEVTPQSSIANISFISQDAALSAELANLMVDQYLNLVKTTPLIKVRRLQSASLNEMNAYHPYLMVQIILCLIVIMGGLYFNLRPKIKRSRLIKEGHKSAAIIMPKISHMPLNLMREGL